MHFAPLGRSLLMACSWQSPGSIQLHVPRVPPVVSQQHVLHSRDSALCTCAPACAQTTALNATGGNPHVLNGALVEFATFSDSFPDVRTLNDTRVSIDNNAGAVSALAGLAVATGSWDQCLQVRCCLFRVFCGLGFWPGSPWRLAPGTSACRRDG